MEKMRGKVQIETVGSVVLKGNPLGDPSVREVPVYLPPSYGHKRGVRYPVLFYLPGFTGTGRAALNYNPWKENLPQRLDRLIATGRAQECVLVVPDGFTAFGGSQYLNSAGTGRYEDHAASELVDFISDKFSVSRRPEGRAIMGKSSGGYGALMIGMRHPDVFGHVVSHSGDMFFEMCYGCDMPKVVNGLAAYGDSALKMRDAFLKSAKKSTFDHACLNMMAMASCYSPNPASPAGFDLPFEVRTGRLLPAVWKRWKENDPVVAAARHRAGLKKLKTLYFDCGTRDEFFLHLGARLFSDELRRLGVSHTYEEHGMGHFDMEERYDVSLALLSKRLKP